MKQAGVSRPDVVGERKRDGLERANPFSIFGPGARRICRANGAGSALGTLSEVERTIFNEIKEMSWGEDFANKVIILKRMLFREDTCFIPKEDHQSHGVKLVKGSTKLGVGPYKAYFNAKIPCTDERDIEIAYRLKEDVERILGIEITVIEPRGQCGVGIVKVNGEIKSEHTPDKKTDKEGKQGQTQLAATDSVPYGC
jgi:hypothetical protein